MKTVPTGLSTVPKLWPGETFVCVASGPSLTSEDVNYCRGKARVIVINNNYQKAPWADVLYACDAKWWKCPEHAAAAQFQGLKYTLTQPQIRIPGLQVLKNTGRSGLELHPSGLRTGANSGYQAINLAIHLGAARILLLGYDMQKQGNRHHWHADHPHQTNSPYGAFLLHFNQLAPLLEKRQIPVINCTRRTALTCFPQQSLTRALPERLEAAS